VREESDSYVQLFHNGSIEAVNASYFHQRENRMYIPITGWEEQLIDAVTNGINVQSTLSLRPPVFVAVSLLGVRGFQFEIYNSYSSSVGANIDRDNLLIPALKIESFDCHVDEVLRPIFDRIWNGAGLRGSNNYDTAGKRKQR